MLLCGLTRWQLNNCKGMREIPWAQVTVSKQYREHAFRKPPSTTMDGGWIKGSFDPWQRPLFIPPISSANTKEKGPLLAGKFPLNSGCIQNCCLNHIASLLEIKINWTITLATVGSFGLNHVFMQVNWTSADSWCHYSMCSCGQW